MPVAAADWAVLAPRWGDRTGPSWPRMVFGKGLEMAEAIDVDVLPGDYRKRQPKSALSDETVARILELVWRDTRMLARTAQQRPLPLFWALARDRMPLLQWYVSWKAGKTMLALNEELDSSECVRRLGPQAVSELARQRDEIEKALDSSRAQLWPTIRGLLQTELMHERILQAARAQLEQQKALSADKPTGTKLLQTSRRLVVVWFSLFRWALYVLKWLLVELAQRGSLFSAEQRAATRARLIERAVLKGLELQRRVELIEESRRLLRPHPIESFCENAIAAVSPWLPGAGPSPASAPGLPGAAPRARATMEVVAPMVGTAMAVWRQVAAAGGEVQQRE